MSLPPFIKRIFDYFGDETLKFLVVGSLGFVINLGVLTLLYKVWGQNIIISQLIAAEAAILSNFILHDRWTYADRIKGQSDSWRIIKFHSTAWTGSAIISFVEIMAVGIFSLNYAISLVIASAIGLVWNFLWNRYFVWRHRAEAKITSA